MAVNDDLIVTHVPYLSDLEIKGLTINKYSSVYFALLYFTLLYMTLNFETEVKILTSMLVSGSQSMPLCL